MIFPGLATQGEVFPELVRRTDRAEVKVVGCRRYPDFSHGSQFLSRLSLVSEIKSNKIRNNLCNIS